MNEYIETQESSGITGLLDYKSTNLDNRFFSFLLSDMKTAQNKNILYFYILSCISYKRSPG